MERNQLIREKKLLLEERKRQCERSYYEFFKAAWKVLEPETALKDNWHVKYLCDEIQWRVERVAAKLPKIRDLIVNLPPRSGKSYIFSIMLFPWIWSKWPHLKGMGSSYDQALSNDNNLKARRVMESNWYQELWGGRFKLTSDQNEKKYFENDRRGHRIAVSVEGGIAGKGCDISVSDDDLDVKAYRSPTKREAAKVHVGQDLPRRINDKEIGLRIIVHQRLHEDDPTGYELRTAPEDYDLICIPAEENDAISPPELKKFYKDGLFFPDHFSKKVCDAMRKRNAREYAAQFLQKPGTEGGVSFPREAWKFYRERPQSFERSCFSWDMSFKKADDASWTVGQVWARRGSDAWLLDQWRQQCGFNAARKAVVLMAIKYPWIKKKLIEDKANGIPIIQSLKSSVEGIEAVEPDGEKLERAEVHAPLVESGCIHLPHPDIAPWILDYIEEFVILNPKGVFDQVDASSQAWDYLYGNDDVAERLERLLKM